MAEVELFRAGQTVPDPEPGDLFLSHARAGWGSALIRVGQRLRYHGASRRYAWWNHAGAFLGSDGTIVEALGSGVQVRNISRYAANDYAVVRIVADPHDRAQMVRFYQHHADARTAYGYLTLVSIGITLVTGSKLVFARHATAICSGLCAAGLTRGDYLLEQATVSTTPADLARMFNVPGPSDDFWQL
jgi:hypothetical protein